MIVLHRWQMCEGFITIQNNIKLMLLMMWLLLMSSLQVIVVVASDYCCYYRLMVHLQAYASALKQTEDEGLPAPPLSVGFTYELCAGIVDKSKSLQQIAADEVRHC